MNTKNPPSHPTAPNQGKRPAHEFNIRIDREHFKVSAETLTGAELRQLPNPGIGADRDLFQVVPGGSDTKIERESPVEMRDGLRFFTAPAQINPGSL
ncbi:MAG TPA: multiubiquitin domain-containing protein [Allosphingosinicella sp.]